MLDEICKLEELTAQFDRKAYLGQQSCGENPGLY